jgi:flagellar FliJ protein
MAEFRLMPLIKLAEERSESASQELQRMRGQWTQAEEKLRQLEGYLADYHARLTQSSASGISVHVMLDFQRFIAKLDLAIKTQNGEVVRCQQRWEKAQLVWQECEREVKAYHALRERHERSELQKENRRDQKAQDEFAQNSLRRRAAEDGTPHS